MSDNKRDIIQKIVSEFRPELYIKRIKCGLVPHQDGKTILKVEFTIDKQKLGKISLENEKVLSWSRELAHKIRNIAKLPIGYTETKVNFI